MPRLAPAEAATTQRIATISTVPGTWVSATAPTIAATTGSRLSRIPKVAVESFRRAASSSVNGSTRAEDGNGEPRGEDDGVDEIRSAPGDPERREDHRGHGERDGQARPDGPVPEHPLGEQDVGRPADGGAEREGEPDRVEVDARAPEERNARAGQADPEEVERPARADHRDREGTEELDRGGQAERDPVDRQVEAAVHRCDRSARRNDPGEREASGAPERRGVDGHEDQRGQRDADPHEAERAHRVEGARRESGAGLDGEGRAEDEQRRRSRRKPPESAQRIVSRASRARSTSPESLKTWSEKRTAPSRGETITPASARRAATSGPSWPGKRAMTMPARPSSSAGVRTSAPRRSSPSRSSRARARSCSSDVLDPEVEQVVDGGGQGGAGRVRGRGVLEPARRRSRAGSSLASKANRVLGRLPADERRVELLPELTAQVADARPRRRAEPLVAGRDEHVHAERRGVERDDAGRLGRVQDEDRADGARQLDETGRVEPVAGRVLDVAHADDLGPLVHGGRDRVEREGRGVVERPRQPDLDPGVARDPQPRVGDARELEVGRDDVLALPRPQPPGDLAERLGRVRHDGDVVGVRAEEPRDSRPGDVADPLLDLVVEADRPAAGDLAPELLAGALHRQRLEPDRARVQIHDLLEHGEVAAGREGGAAGVHSSPGALTSSLRTSGRW